MTMHISRFIINQYDDYERVIFRKKTEGVRAHFYMQSSGDSTLVLSSHFSFNSIGTFFFLWFSTRDSKARPASYE